MRISTLRWCLCWGLSALLPLTCAAQDVPDKSGGAILHTQGGVWVNGYEAHDSSAVFAGDSIETKTGASANLSLEGSTVLLAPETVGKFQGDLLELDHGAVSVTTSRSFKVKVKCILVVPVQNEWTEYAVTDITPTLQVSARKLDVNVERERSKDKDKEPAANTDSERASVHEGEQKSYNETDVCGAAAPASPGSGISPKWIAAGAAGAGLLILLFIHGGGSKPPASPSAP